MRLNSVCLFVCVFVCLHSNGQFQQSRLVCELYTYYPVCRSWVNQLYRMLRKYIKLTFFAFFILHCRPLPKAIITTIHQNCNEAINDIFQASLFMALLASYSCEMNKYYILIPATSDRFVSGAENSFSGLS